MLESSSRRVGMRELMVRYAGELACQSSTQSRHLLSTM
jgi:hypothetical protein